MDSMWSPSWGSCVNIIFYILTGGICNYVNLKSIQMSSYLCFIRCEKYYKQFHTKQEAFWLSIQPIN